MATQKKNTGKSEGPGPKTLEIFENLFKKELEDLSEKGQKGEVPQTDSRKRGTQSPLFPPKAPGAAPRHIGKHAQGARTTDTAQTGTASLLKRKKAGRSQVTPVRASIQTPARKTSPVDRVKTTPAGPIRVISPKRNVRSSSASIAQERIAPRRRALGTRKTLTGEVKIKARQSSELPLRKMTRGEARIPNKISRSKNLSPLKMTLVLLILLILGGFLLRQYDLLGHRDSEKPPGIVKRKITAKPSPHEPVSRSDNPDKRPYDTPSGPAKKSVARVPAAIPNGSARGPAPAEEQDGTLTTAYTAQRIGAAIGRSRGSEMEEEKHVVARSKKKSALQEEKAAPGRGFNATAKATSADNTGNVSREKATAKPRQPKSSSLIAAVNKWTPSYPYSVYLGSYQSLPRIRKTMATYRNAGISTYWAKVDLGAKGIWYRLFTGCFHTRVEADSFIVRHELKEGSSRRTRYAILLGIDESAKGLEAKRQSLVNAGYSPYVIKGSKGQYGLFLGAFYQKSRAITARTSLAQRRFPSEVVMR